MHRLVTMRQPPLEWRPWCGLAIFSVEGKPPPWGNNVWAAWITARARVRLAEEIAALELRGCKPLYCDTDSVIFQKGERSFGRYRNKAREVGQFELRGRYTKAIIVGKKEYALRSGESDWEIATKGIPKSQREQYLTNGHATFVRPVRIRESSRIGIPANVWRTVEKIRRTDLRKKAEENGNLPVPIVELRSVENGKEEG